MEIKVKCICGSVYSFEDTPVNGRLAHPVSCTNCGADGTEKAHAYIAAKLGEKSGSIPAAKSHKGLFGIGKKKNEFADLDVESATYALDNSGSPTSDETSLARLFFAGAGALGVGVVGAVIWLIIAKATGYEFGYVAWALGAAVGGTSRLLAPRGHHWLGLTGAVAAFIAISGGEMLTATWFVGEAVDTSISAAYEDAADYAKEAAAAKSDDDLRSSVATYKLVTEIVDENPKGAIATYQNYQIADGGLTFLGVVEANERHKITFARRVELSSEEKVTAEQISRFKAKVLPELKTFVAGTPSQEEYESTFTQMITSRITLKSLFIQSIGPYSCLWVMFGIASAYKLARNPGLEY